MVKVYGPMMSLDASGTLADAITFSKWKGRNYVRERVIPSNPQSGAQVGRRALWTFLTQNWAGLTAGQQSSWQVLADEIVASRFNAYLRDNMQHWHNYIPPTADAGRAEAGIGSDRVLSAAAWEQNRIKISSTATTANQQWGMVIYGSLTTPITEAVGNTIIVVADDDIAAHDYYWTPPEVNTWYFDSTTFSIDGVLAAPGGEQSAVP